MIIAFVMINATTLDTPTITIDTNADTPDTVDVIDDCVEYLNLHINDVQSDAPNDPKFVCQSNYYNIYTKKVLYLSVCIT